MRGYIFGFEHVLIGLPSLFAPKKTFQQRFNLVTVSELGQASTLSRAYCGVGTDVTSRSNSIIQHGDARNREEAALRQMGILAKSCMQAMEELTSPEAIGTLSRFTTD